MPDSVNNTLPKSEILFLYESTYSIPNGDPFTGEQRFDEETKKVLVSDVRIKRFIRDHFAQTRPNEVYVLNDASLKGAPNESKDPESGAAARHGALFGDLKGVKAETALKTLIDVKLFGGILTKTSAAVNVTGPVQFALLNPSLNAVELRMHQNTSVFASSTTKARGAIGTTTVVPYALNQIHGWVNPFAAEHTGLQQTHLDEMFTALWESINNANTRSKSNQNSLLLLQIIYAEKTKKLYGLDRKIKLTPKDNKREEQIRSIDDYDLDFTALNNAVQDEKIGEVLFHTDHAELQSTLQDFNKFKAMNIE